MEIKENTVVIVEYRIHPTPEKVIYPVSVMISVDSNDDLDSLIQEQKAEYESQGYHKVDYVKFEIV